MQLPGPLREAIERELAGCDGARLRAAAARLSLIYRSAADAAMGAPSPGGAMAGDIERAAYLAVRMPATFAAVSAALGWTREACCHEEFGEEQGGEIRSMLDLGSGPGTALWAATQLFPTLTSATAVERDTRLIEIGRRLAAQSEDIALREASWLCGDVTAELPAGRWDLVICAYVLNEMDRARQAELIRQAWTHCAKLLVIIEPGSRAGFANVLAARSQMLAPDAPGDAASNATSNEVWGDAVLVAPCPHSLDCPMAAGGDWCHFAARVERTALHRRLKEATLGHEDEKFSYVAFMREPAPAARAASVAAYPPAPAARMVRHPRLFSGYAQLTLCRAGQISTITVTRSQKEDWRRLKRLGWGDRW